MIFPYLELPLIVGYGEQEAKIVKLKTQPANVSSYHEGYEPNTVFIYENAQAFQIALSIEQYEAQIAAYWNLVNTKKDIKTKLGIVR